jgi:hypothetical protein
MISGKTSATHKAGPRGHQRPTRVTERDSGSRPVLPPDRPIFTCRRTVESCRARCRSAIQARRRSTTAATELCRPRAQVAFRRAGRAYRCDGWSRSMPMTRAMWSRSWPAESPDSALGELSRRDAGLPAAAVDTRGAVEVRSRIEAAQAEAQHDAEQVCFPGTRRKPPQVQ